MTSSAHARYFGRMVVALGVALVVLTPIAWLLWRKRRRRLEQEAIAAELARQHEAAERERFKPVEARAALTQWVLLRQELFTLDDAMNASCAAGRPMTRSECEDVCATLSVAVPSLRAVLPPETLRPLPPGGERRKHTYKANGARVISLRPPETMGMTRAEYEEWRKGQKRGGAA